MKSACRAVAIWCALCLPTVRVAAADANGLIRALVKPDLAALAPEAAIKRFAKLVPLERSQPYPGRLLLTGGDSQQGLELRYEPDATGTQHFAQAALRLSAADSDAQYRDVERLLRKKLGKPQYERRDDGPLPTLGWRLGTLEVALAQTATRNVRLVEVSITQPR
jgi:hypothetical protein